MEPVATTIVLDSAPKPTSTVTPLRYRADLDGLRGIAVLVVVGFHAFPSVISGGFVGVDVFFVISGFLISSLVLGEVREARFSFARFYSRRIRRLFPALVTVLAATIAAGWFLLPGTSFGRLGATAAAASVFSANFAFWRQSGYFDAAAATKPLLHLWSLGVEEQFYLTWPFMLVLASRRAVLTRPVIVIIGMLSFAAGLVLARTDAAGAYYLPHVRAWELLAGTMLVSGHSKETVDAPTERFVLRDAAGAIGVLLIVAASIGFSAQTSFPGWEAVVPVSGAVLVIAAGPDGWLNRRALSQPWLVGLGLVSYPLYLWHWPLLSLARLTHPAELTMSLRLGLIALSVVLAYATYHFVESPIRFGRFKKSGRAIAVLAACSAAIGLAGVLASTGNLATRSDRRFRSITARVYDYHAGYRGRLCQLGSGQTPADFATTCVDPDFGVPGKQGILLWGDSHAAHLYPGFRALSGAYRLTIAQFTGDGCPPVLHHPSCHDINDFVLQRLPRLRPDVIVLAADWNTDRIALLPETVARIRELVSSRIVVVGDVPKWSPTLPDVLATFARENPSAPAPERLRVGVNPGRIGIDAEMRRIVASLPVTYVSPISAMCNNEGCLAVVHETMTTWDDAHLTDVGSTIVATAIVKELRLQ